MRVVAGKYKGFILQSPKSNTSRPTDNKVKEAIFDMLYPFRNEFTALDLFAGTGQMGIEFLSRGAREVTFNERNSSTFSILNKNIDKVKASNVNVDRLDFKKALKKYKDCGREFDYIFLDPPYEGDLVKQSVKLILEYELLANEGIIITESDKELDFSDMGELTLIKEKSYGRKQVNIYKANESYLSR
ncbi:MAG: 16S rRNA (guanine(966)-N(2))-methyltransferase RsmD [Anaerococcus sp.]|uniref:16S rRNA (guanine(966)-N(2))-methyltransferase RsmD n=1 Tax=Anaerococcus sp. TaxID=1872515 RepID=UPI0026317270|nr:16S rRNA (guanine(966)-N(2))-methyltransferase RsmD [Anaerococcus sp.]MCI5972690.1 16S rRNA (guanine(966)-N(2))-methyltransferase RsmD [Anaerococcus sp.]MDD6918735.1 16S rRNA (guanine(966)-N(2))-methyltransferase RsmD [Peptoniphilaceae bacterium]MDY2928220.1 16S rRNA (guanine(966)-N(2))-methyltransferase RsmD [Anaerococcus sp.]